MKKQVADGSRLEAFGDYWWVHSKADQEAFTLPFRTVQEKQSNITPTIQKLHLLGERQALGSKKSRPDQPFNVVQVRLAADPGALKRFKKPSNPEKLPTSTCGSGVSSSWPPPGPAPKSFTYPQPKKREGLSAYPSGRGGRMLTQSKTGLEQRLEQMAVGDLVTGRMQLTQKPGKRNMIAKHATMPRDPMAPLYSKRQRSPVRTTRIADAERQALEEGQELLRQSQSRQSSSRNLPRRPPSASGQFALPEDGAFVSEASIGLPIVANAMEILYEEDKVQSRPATRESAVQYTKRSVTPSMRTRASKSGTKDGQQRPSTVQPTSTGWAANSTSWSFRSKAENSGPAHVNLNQSAAAAFPRRPATTNTTCRPAAGSAYTPPFKPNIFALEEGLRHGEGLSTSPVRLNRSAAAAYKSTSAAAMQEYMRRTGIDAMIPA